MKTQMDRKYPILVDIGSQVEKDPSHEYVFFYDDGAVYRAFSCDQIDTSTPEKVSALLSGKVIVTVPSETVWRFIHKDNLEFVAGSDMEEIELTNLKQKKDIQKKLIKSLGLDKDDTDSIVAHEYKEGYNPKMYA